MHKKIKTSVTLSREVVKWIDKQIVNKRFASRSHAVEYCIDKVMKGEK